jgi:enediyne biosynthesis protein E4
MTFKPSIKIAFNPPHFNSLKSVIPGLIRFLLIAIIFNTSTGCSSESDKITNDQLKNKLLRSIPSSQSNITFNNLITETQQLNYIAYDGVYQGAGVAVGDINNDGLPDIYFVGNMVPNKLYLNKGNLVFEDITESSGADVSDGWCTGVNIIDVNGDGWNDIYICRYLLEDPNLCRNMLLINNGDNTFTDETEKYKVGDTGFSVMATFFDFDNDGDLDLYVVNQPPSFRNSRQALHGKIDYRYTDRLYENIENKYFEDITEKAGITNYAYGLSACAFDYDHDGYTDLYIANDYEEGDLLYRNNGDGTFSNTILEATRHVPNFSMGADVADINNDGWPDLFVADMVAQDNKRIKTNMSGMDLPKFYGLVGRGNQYQYMYNALQLNQGNGFFSEIAQLAGVSNTDWSWAALFMDLDHDGFRDLLVTNGMRRDMRDNDYNKRLQQIVEQKSAEAKAAGTRLQLDYVSLVDMAPKTGIANYFFQNQGDLTFKNLASDWGVAQKMVSYGAAYADLDGDGDLDLVLNNMDTIANIFENTINEHRKNHYLRVRLKGPKSNMYGLGSRLRIYYGDEIQSEELTNVRGYMSASEPIAHFGFKNISVIDKLEIIWPDNKTTTLLNVKSDQLLEVDYRTQATNQDIDYRVKPTYFEAAPTHFAGFEHKENLFIDYQREILLPHMMSALGPKIAVADMDGDGLEDLIVGGAKGFPAVQMMQQTDGSFTARLFPWMQDAAFEDLGLHFFDANGNGHLDLYVVSGGNEAPAGSSFYQDRLYLNNGHGVFQKSTEALPGITISGSCAISADINGDGQLDLFVGGRQYPGRWPSPVSSLILTNQNGKFRDVTAEVAPELLELGMVTDARWHDFNNDGYPDLIVVGEWMPITVFINEKGKLRKLDIPELKNTRGWWNCIELADIDGDGNMDLIAGNLGTNIKYKTSTKEPFQVFADDFDDNGTFDIYLGYYQDGVCYPVRGRECSSQQMPFVKSKFPNYNKFSEATIYEVLGAKAETALNLKADIFESVVIKNLGNFSFEMVKLPIEAQFSTVQAVHSGDFNNDGFIDLLICGNFFEREVETTRSDASVGLLLLGDGKFNFEPIAPYESGFYAKYNARDMRALQINNKKSFVIANNSGPLDVFQLKPEKKTK